LHAVEGDVARTPHKLKRIEGGEHFEGLRGGDDFGEGRDGGGRFAVITERFRGDDANIGELVAEERAQAGFRRGRAVLQNEATERTPVTDARIRIGERGAEVGKKLRVTRGGTVGEIDEARDGIGGTLRVVVEGLRAGEPEGQALGEKTGVAGRDDFGAQGTAQRVTSRGRGRIGSGDEVAEFVGIAGETVEFFGGFRLPVSGLDVVAAAGREFCEPRAHARLDLERIRVMLTPRAVRRVVAHVAILAVAHGADDIGALIHATSVKKNVFAGRRFLFAEERAALVVRRNRHAAEAENGGGKIDKGDGVLDPLAGLRGREVRPFGGDAHDEGHARPRIVDIAFPPRQRAAVVAVVKDDRVLGEAGLGEFGESGADLGVHHGHLIVVVGPIASDFGRVGMIGRQLDFFRRNPERGLAGLGRDLAFVAGGEIEDGEKRLTGRAVFIVGLSTARVPRLAIAGQVVVGLRIVGRVVTGRTQDFGVKRERRGDRDATPVVLGAERGRIHAGDERGPRGGAHGGVGKREAIPDALRGEPVEMRRLRLRIAVAAEVGAVVLAGQPEDIRAFGGRQRHAAQNQTKEGHRQSGQRLRARPRQEGGAGHGSRSV
jgi:hypothetical protein